MTTPNPDWVFYYALYHLVYHWAAYVAFLVLLLTTGVVLCVSPVARHKWFVALAILVTGAASTFSLFRMHTFGTVVNDNLSGAASAMMWTPGPLNLVIGGIIVLALVILDFVVLLKR